MSTCSALNCMNRGRRKGRESDIHMRRFPVDPERRKAWATQLKRENWEPTNNSFLCDNHFDDDQFEKEDVEGKRKLKWNALPTIFSDEKPVSKRKLPTSGQSLLKPKIVRMQETSTSSTSTPSSAVHEVCDLDLECLVECQEGDSEYELPKSSLSPESSVTEPSAFSSREAELITEIMHLRQEVGVLSDEIKTAKKLPKPQTPAATSQGPVIVAVTSLSKKPPAKQIPAISQSLVLNSKPSVSKPTIIKDDKREKLLLKQAQEKNNRIRALQKANLQNRITIQKLKQMLKNFKQKKSKNLQCNLYEIVESLQGVQRELFVRLLSKAKNGDQPITFSPETASFALTLYFHSPKAYDFVRESFNECLPSIRTLQRWFMLAANPNESNADKTNNDTSSSRITETIESVANTEMETDENHQNVEEPSKTNENHHVVEEPSETDENSMDT